MDAFGRVTIETPDNRTALSPIYQGRRKFSINDNKLDEKVGNAYVSPHGLCPSLELNDQYSGEEPDIRLLMEHAERAMSDFYSQEFQSYEEESPADLRLVEAAEITVRQRARSGG